MYGRGTALPIPGNTGAFKAPAGKGATGPAFSYRTGTSGAFYPTEFIYDVTSHKTEVDLRAHERDARARDLQSDGLPYGESQQRRAAL